MGSTTSFSSGLRFALGSAITVLALLILAAGLTIPFKFESFSILYKFGLEKFFLRSGKMVGITVVVLVFYQVVLASRFKLFERIFSLKTMLFLHRIIGMCLGGIVILHPLLIKASENFTPYTFEKKYYPEFIGIALLTILLILVLTAILRNYFKFSYRGWLLVHRIFATLVIFIMPAHVLYVSETFKTGPPRTAALLIFSLNLIMLAVIWLKRITRKAG